MDGSFIQHVLLLIIEMTLNPKTFITHRAFLDQNLVFLNWKVYEMINFVNKKYQNNFGFYYLSIPKKVVSYLHHILMLHVHTIIQIFFWGFKKVHKSYLYIVISHW